MHRRLLRALLVSLLACAAMAQGDEPVQVDLEAFLVRTVTLQDGTTEERFSPATRARPGQVIEYRLAVTNTDELPLPPESVRVVGPVPEGTAYVADSAAPIAGAARLEASLDGATFAVPPLLVTVTNEAGEEVEVEADPADWAALRWVVLEPLEPGQGLRLVYRVTVR